MRATFQTRQPAINLTSEERKIKKVEKRAKQRQANGNRATKMHAARLGSTLSLPIETPPAPTINVGCSGWFYWHWRKGFYPESLPTKEWFAYYTRHFSTVELNAPFYSWPTINTVKSWLKQASSSRFIYTVKVCELITHVKRFVGTKTLVKDFGFIGDLLKGHAGCFLFQLPPSYSYTARRLARILKQLEPERRSVVEFRHRSWWNKNVYAAFKKKGVIFCSCSHVPYGCPSESFFFNSRSSTIRPSRKSTKNIRPGCSRPLALMFSGSIRSTPTSLAMITRSSCVR